MTSEIESQVAEFDAGAQQVEASAKTSQMAVSQNNVAAPYAKPFAPCDPQKSVGSTDEHDAGGAGLQQVLPGRKKGKKNY